MAGNTEYKNNWQKENVEGVIKAHAEAHSESVNGFINRAIDIRPWSGITPLLGPLTASQRKTIPLTNSRHARYNAEKDVKTMLDEKDLQAIRSIVKREVDDAEQRITKNAVAMMEAYFDPKFNLLADGIADIQEKLVPRSRVDDLEEEVKFLKSVIRQISEDVQKLKKAN